MIKLRILGEEGFINKLFNKKKSPQQLYDYAQELFSQNNVIDGCSAMQMAAQLGHAEAAFTMACLIKQENFPATAEEMVSYLTIAADQNHMFALSNLGYCYQQGIGVSCDGRKAVELFSKAFSLGDDMAGYNLAQTLLIGIGVKQDYDKGLQMLISLAKSGHELSIQYLDDLRNNGLDIPESIYKLAVDHNVDYAPDCFITDSYIYKLYNNARNGDKASHEELMELCGNQFNRQAMNALRKLGKIKENQSQEFKDGCLSYIYDAWVAFNPELLHILVLWTYPSFTYAEYTKRDDSWYIIFETDEESVFIKRITSEMDQCKSSDIKPEVEFLENTRTSERSVRVSIGEKNVSVFHLRFQDNHFIGLYRVYNKIDMTNQELINC